MQRDIETGRPNELDAIGGAVVRHGRSADVPTPVVEGLIKAALEVAQRRRSSLR
jgi:ketopantoate reductase